MSARTIPASAYIDSMRFAQSGQRLNGEIPVTELGRLRDILVEREGVARYALEGGVVSGRPTLRLSVEAELSLTCQRCLEPCKLIVTSESVMPLARNERELARWEAEDPLLDAQVADPKLEVRTLVEDEILLSLPIMPRHADGECSVAAG